MNKVDMSGLEQIFLPILALSSRHVVAKRGIS